MTDATLTAAIIQADRTQAMVDLTLGLRTADALFALGTDAGIAEGHRIATPTLVGEVRDCSLGKAGYGAAEVSAAQTAMTEYDARMVTVRAL